MTVALEEIREVTQKYVAEHPQEVEKLEKLVWSIDNATDLTSRKELRGHVTCGVVLLDTKWRVLHIRHKALDRWLLPGGHLESEDTSLTAAALRELGEEVGIEAHAVAEVEGLRGPLDIDAHLIPYSRDKDEDEHWHFDFRHVFRTETRDIVLQAEEVTGHRWLTADMVASGSVGRKLSALRDR